MADSSQVMLAAGNEQLYETSQPLCNIYEEKNDCQQELAGLECKERNHVDVSHETMVEAAAKKHN